MKKLLLILIVGLLSVGLYHSVKATTCAQAVSIPGSPSFPYVSTLTCGTTNDISSANSTTCGNSSYKGGWEAVYEWTPAGNYINVSFAYTGQTWTGLFLYEGCPTSGGLCIATFTSSSSSKTLAYVGHNLTSGTPISLSSGVMYYLVIDTYPTPNSPCPGTITINGTLNNPCSGTPDPGNTLSSTPSACSGVNFTLSLQNTTPGTGVTYQWQYGPSNTGPWTGFGPNASTATTSQIAASWYQCVVTCTNSGFSGTSIPVQVTMNVASVPYEEGFLTTTTPACWNITGWTIGAARGVTGNPGNNIYMNLWSSATTGTFTTGNIGPVSADMVLTFDYKLANYTTPYDPPASGSGNYVVSVSGDGGASYDVLETVANDGTAGWQSKSYPLTSYIGSNIMIKIVGNWVSGDYDLAFDNIKVFAATAPALVVVPSTINFGTVPSGSYGYNQYVLSGTNLAGYTDNIVVTAPVGFEVSLDNSDWYGAVNVEYTSATLPNTTIFVRFAPSGPPAAYSGNITNVGGGTKASANVAVSGSSWIIIPNSTCQTISGTFPTTGIKIAVVMTTTNAYDFSCCALDATCAGSGGTGNDIDFTMFGPDGTTQLWYIDGASSCGWNATTWGSLYNAWVPPANGTYYLQIDDYYNIAGSFTLGYITSVPTTTSTWTGLADTDWDNTGNWNPAAIPTNTVKVIIPTGCPNYPYIDAPAVCNKLTINSGGSLYMIDSFFDVFTEVSCSGTLNISGGTMDVTNNLYLPTTTSTLIMSNGTLNVGGIFQTAAYTWSNGLYTLSGGTINMSGTAFFSGGTGSTMSGNFVFNVGGTLQIPSTMWTMTGGTINLLGTETTVNYFLPPTGTGTAVAYNLNVNSGANSYIFSRDATVNFDAIVNNFSIQTGTVNLASALGTGYPGTFTVGGNMDVAANNTANLTIPAATTFNVAGAAYQSLKSLTGYGSVIGNVNGTYNFNVEIEGLATGRWILISPPVSGVTASAFNCQFLMKHDPIANTWSDIVDPLEPLVPGVDYALWVHPDAMVDIAPCATIPPLTNFTWTGSQNIGPISVPLLSDDLLLEGWNNVGNPYQATIDWDAVGWTKTNVNNAIYYENGTPLWSTYINGVSVLGGTQYIAPGQGFFVQCNNLGGGTLGFAPATRTHTRTSFFKNSVANMIKLQASGNSYNDETVIRFHEEATNGFDSNLDAHKLFASLDEYPEVPQIYSLDNGFMVVNALASAEQVAVGFKSGINGTFTINMTENNDIPIAILEDLFTGNLTDLNTSSYTFDYSISDNDARFIVHFTPLGISDNFASFVNVYAENKDVYVSVPANTKGDIVVYNLMGQEVARTLITDVLNKITLDKSAYYLVKVMSNESVVTKKVFVK